MGMFYTDVQIREAIAALESYSPGIWEIMKKMALVAEPDTDEHVAEQSAIVLALARVLPNVSFVKQAPDPLEASNLLLIDLRKAIRAEIDDTKIGS
ncbi:hypothetical protein [Bradyrhizobium sp. CCBAU 53338]|uniref:hypothetical protein n=1 Tax=Bradyrhizobium sp. CCBAU 53338 TaxID=1325111 RepID=UPI00188AA68C|nr:hypothetical protein [Bradyrhizobium sp. CCBAU 53338]QOZ55341.1 hypothetical protein XH90_31125 [Bradyrhizobium sp. CCBAU 53338]